MTTQADKGQLKALAHDWASRLNVGIRAVSIRTMSKKWASCSTEGRLTFNSDLLDLDEELQEYVVVHELLHLSVPNHGRLWKSLMRAHLGAYEALEDRLRQVATSLGGLSA